MSFWRVDYLPFRQKTVVDYLPFRQKTVVSLLYTILISIDIAQNINFCAKACIRWKNTDKVCHTRLQLQMY